MTKSGTKWDDKNGNGVRDGGDNGLQTWTINLYDSTNALIQSKTTDVNGAYSFDPVGPGSYTVCETVKSGWVQTFPNALTPNPSNETIASNCVPPGGSGFGYHFTAQSGHDLSGNDFGNFEKVTKSGQKWEDNNGDGAKNGSDAGLTNWTINLYDSTNTLIQSKITNGSGNYTFDPVGPGSYTVCETVKSGWVQTFPNALTPNPSNETIASNCVPPSGTAFGYHFTAQSGVDIANNDFGNFKKVTKSGIKWQDKNGNGVRDGGDNGLQGWTINLYDSGNNLIQSKTTDVNGNYSFDPVGPGSYTVCESVLSGFTQTFPNGSTPNPPNETIATNCVPPNGTAFGYHFTAKSGVDLDGNDFGNFKPPTKSGMKWEDKNGNGTKDAGDTGLSTWTIQALDPNNNSVLASAVTDANGNYQLTFPNGGTFNVCELLKSGWVQTYPNASTPDPNAPSDKVLLGGCPGGLNGYVVIVASGDTVTGNDFGNFKTITKSGQKWEDHNGDGVKNGADAGLSGWGINLYDSNNTFLMQTVTNGSGNYSFNNLGPGTYKVCEVLQARLGADVPEWGYVEAAGDDHQQLLAAGWYRVRVSVHGPERDGRERQRLRELRQGDEVGSEVGRQQRRRHQERERCGSAGVDDQPVQLGQHADPVEGHRRERELQLRSGGSG